MGWFKKAQSQGSEGKLPDLPKLPELPKASIQENPPNTKTDLPKLPSFPDDSLGNKFSQDTIKEAVTGKKEDWEVPADEVATEREMQMMPEPPREIKTRELPSEIGIDQRMSQNLRNSRTKEAEPIFIRIDKFEESLKNFENVKKQLGEIEKILRDVKRVKEEEEKELQAWETDVQNVKSEIEKIDQDVFSKVE